MNNKTINNVVAMRIVKNCDREVTVWTSTDSNEIVQCGGKLKGKRIIHRCMICEFLIDRFELKESDL